MLTSIEPDKGESHKGKRRFLLWSAVVLAIFVIGGMLRFPPVLIVLWTVGEIVIPAWEAVDPTVPRQPGRLRDLSQSADAETRGKALRAEVDKFYATAPETRKSLLRKMLAPPYVGAAGYDFGQTVQNYIPAGTSFDEAVRILKAAGMTIFLPPILIGHTIEAELERYTDRPAGYMRFRVELYPRHDDTAAGPVVARIDAWLAKNAGAPVPPVKFVLDAAKPSTMQATIKVVDERFYRFDLAFHATRLDQLENVRKLAGDAYLGPGIETRPPRDPGVVIPLQVVVTTEAQHVIYDRTRDTLGTYASSRMRVHRTVGGLQLAPGLYHLRVSTLKDIPELADVAVEFSVGWDARF